MNNFVHFQSVADLFRFFNVADKLQHPLVGIIDFGTVAHVADEDISVSCDFYTLICKNYNKNNVKYGRKVVDFHNGSLICLAPGQGLEMNKDDETPENMEGWGLFFHPDLIRTTFLNSRMKDYSFFSYEISEALHLSEKEKQTLLECVHKIDNELKENIDAYSQSIVVSTIELLLNYCARFYGRQFITRKSSNNMVVAQIEKILTGYFSNDDISEKGLPTVKLLAEQVHLSTGYLSDLLKKETGRNTQEHIHFYLIEAAKNVLLNTNKSVGEIAYSLGFEYPQYFNKLFKLKTGKTPVEFRSMN